MHRKDNHYRPKNGSLLRTSRRAATGPDVLLFFGLTDVSLAAGIRVGVSGTSSGAPPMNAKSRSRVEGKPLLRNLKGEPRDCFTCELPSPPSSESDVVEEESASVLRDGDPGIPRIGR